jgi:hypothetical protein
MATIMSISFLVMPLDTEMNLFLHFRESSLTSLSAIEDTGGVGQFPDHRSTDPFLRSGLKLLGRGLDEHVHG